MERLTKLKPECFTDINQAHLDMMMSDGTTVMEFVANKVPCTIDVFTQMLDKSITIDERECGLVRIALTFDRIFTSLLQVRLDFNRVFRSTWNTRTGQGDMDFFFGLIKSPFKTCLEHPLLWAFLNMKLVQV